MKFERRLQLLFDAQNFFREPKLDAIINDDSVRPLDDDELERLFAAGDLVAAEEEKDGRGNDK